VCERVQDPSLRESAFDATFMVMLGLAERN